MPLKHLTYSTLGSTDNPTGLLILSVCTFRFSLIQPTLGLMQACMVAMLGRCEQAGWLLSRGLQCSQARGGVEIEILCPRNPSSYCQATKRRKAGPCKDQQTWALRDFNNEGARTQVVCHTAIQRLLTHVGQADIRWSTLNILCLCLSFPLDFDST